MSVRPEELAQFRSESGVSQKEFAELLNEALDMHYSGSQVSQWERGVKNIPSYVQDVILSLMGNPPESTPSPEGRATGETPETASSRRPDIPPTPPEDFQLRNPLPVPQGSPLEAVAVEMFRGIGQTVEMIGAFTGGPKIISVQGGPNISILELDGRTISADAESLGKAWAHLAETNTWVARVLTSLTTGGAWVEVIMATSGTAFKVYQNHAGYNKWLAEQSRQPEPEPVPENDGSLL
jgi:transcriptional regulator with XRE-family HTH domain